MPGKSTAGKRITNGMVWPHNVQEMGGMMRRAPSSQPMYQSGCTA